MPPHPSTNFEIQKCYKNKLRLNGVFSRDNMPKKIKDGAYVINLDEQKDVGTHWIALLCSRSKIVYFNSLVLNMFQKKLKNLSGIKI